MSDPKKLKSATLETFSFVTKKTALEQVKAEDEIYRELKAMSDAGETLNWVMHTIEEADRELLEADAVFDDESLGLARVMKATAIANAAEAKKKQAMKERDYIRKANVARKNAMLKVADARTEGDHNAAHLWQDLVNVSNAVLSPIDERTKEIERKKLGKSKAKTSHKSGPSINADESTQQDGEGTHAVTIEDEEEPLVVQYANADRSFDISEEMMHTQSRKRAAKVEANPAQKQKMNRVRGFTAKAQKVKQGLTMEKFQAKINSKYTWREQQYPNMKDETFEYTRDGKVLCRCCNKLVDFYTLAQHIHGGKAQQPSKHQQNKEAKKGVLFQRQMVNRIQEWEEATPEVNARPLSAQDKEFGMDVLFTCFAANMPLSNIQNMNHILKKYTVQRSIDSDYLAQFVEPLHEAILESMKSIYRGSYREYSITFDGTSSSAQAEAMSITFVTHDFEIVDFVLKVQLLTKYPKVEALAMSILHAMTSNLTLLTKNWMAIHNVRASVNEEAVDWLGKCVGGIEVRRGGIMHAKCNSDALDNTGTNFVDSKAMKLRQLLTEVFEPTAKISRMVFKEHFHEAAKVRDDVHWYVECEMAEQIDRIDVCRIVTVVRDYIDEDCSPEARADLIDFVGDTANLVRAIVENAAVVDVGLVFCKAAYNLNGDNPLVLVAHKIFQKLDHQVAVGFDYSRLEKAAEKAVDILRKENVNSSFERLIAASRQKLDWANFTKESSSRISRPAWDEESKGNDTVDENALRGGASSEQTAVLDYLRIGEETTAMEEAKVDSGDYEKNVEEAQKEVDKALQSREDFRVEAAGLTAAEFIAHGKCVVAPGIKHYDQLYNDANGELYSLKQAILAARVLDPRELKSMSLDEAQALVRQFLHFGFPKFTFAFIQQLLDELPRLKECAEAYFDWSAVDGAAEYNKAIREKRHKRWNERAEGEPPAESREVVYNTWEEDPGEESRRVWQWWKVHRSQLHHFSEAARLIVLTKMSSAFVQRLFSNINCIGGLCREEMLEETVETRLFVLENMVRRGIHLMPTRT